MSPKRKDRVAPPAVNDEWDLRFGTNEAVKGGEELCRQAATNTRVAFDTMRSNPRPPEDKRHTRLRGDLATRTFDGRTLDQWEIEVTRGGRIFYLVDDAKHIVWIMVASTAHPKITE